MIALYKDYCCPEVRFKLGTGYFPQANVFKVGQVGSDVEVMKCTR